MTDQQDDYDQDEVAHDVEVDVDVAAWRRDPEESFSDWTIHVRPITNDKKAGGAAAVSTTLSGTNDCSIDGNDSHHHHTYHVHRVYLASGPRCSEYFRTLFSTNMSTEETSSKSTILELQNSACNAFPALLDYIYTGHIYVGGNIGDSGSGKETATASNGDGTDDDAADADASTALSTETGADSIKGKRDRSSSSQESSSMSEAAIVALLYLADYLQVANLVPATSEYILEELNANNVHLFCREALLYGIDWIVDCCVKIAASSPKHLCSKIELRDVDSEETGIDQHHDDDSVAAASAVDSEGGEDEATTPTKPPAQQVLEMLPPSQQIELLQLSLQRSVDELARFKRVPSRWKDNIDETAVATHMPQMIGPSGFGAGRTGIQQSEFFHQPYAQHLTGCGLPFHNKVCPVFYFDEALIQNNDQDDNDDDDTHRYTLNNNPPSPERVPRQSVTRRVRFGPVNRDILSSTTRYTVSRFTAPTVLGSTLRGGPEQRSVHNFGGSNRIYGNYNRIIVRGTSQNAMHRD